MKGNSTILFISPFQRQVYLTKFSDIFYHISRQLSDTLPSQAQNGSQNCSLCQKSLSKPFSYLVVLYTSVKTYTFSFILTLFLLIAS